ncbi:uncharacterized protein [Hemitrygon akajei]|uniref:uncharacterized protein isoform X1 n=1 Tax=Hemitrygon akajei TaxID=2704970 RepID=UPI003BF9C5FF
MGQCGGSFTLCLTPGVCDGTVWRELHSICNLCCPGRVWYQTHFIPSDQSPDVRWTHQSTFRPIPPAQFTISSPQGNQPAAGEAGEGSSDWQEDSTEPAAAQQRPSNQRRRLPAPYFFRNRFRRQRRPQTPEDGVAAAAPGEEVLEGSGTTSQPGQGQPQQPAQRGMGGARFRPQFRRRPFRPRPQPQEAQADENQDPKTEQQVPERRRYRRPFFRRRPADQRSQSTDAEEQKAQPTDAGTTPDPPANGMTETAPAAVAEPVSAPVSIPVPAPAPVSAPAPAPVPSPVTSPAVTPGERQVTKEQLLMPEGVVPMATAREAPVVAAPVSLETPLKVAHLAEELPAVIPTGQLGKGETDIGSEH